MDSASVGLVIGLYLLPSFIAMLRKHQNVSGVVIVNILTGWSGIGWIAALVMACTGGRIEPAAKYDVYTGERLKR